MKYGFPLNISLLLLFTFGAVFRGKSNFLPKNRSKYRQIMAERPEDLNLPSAVVSRIVKEALPSSVKVSKEAHAAIAKAASVFVLYATSCANNCALKAHRKTIQGTDIIKAMEDMEFDKFIRPLENSLECKRFSDEITV